jgi:predicted GTPase
MSRWRVLTVGLLVASPFLVLAGLGSCFLWKEGLGLLVWWPMAACVILGYLLAWYWQKRNQLLRPLAPEPPLEWTDRDRKAWELVRARMEGAAKLDQAKLQSLQFYVDTAQEMALEIARSYHPGADDPISFRTIPEILAVAELAAHDLAELVDTYLPGGHLLTLKDWRRFKQIGDWYRAANTVYWAVSALFSPLNTGMRYGVSWLGTSKPMQVLQQNLLAWFYSAYAHRLGTYLIELNSGRLKVGARRYAELRDALKDRGRLTADGPPVPAQEEPGASSPAVPHLLITVLGQVKSGKSSLINALLKEQRAATDVLAATSGITRYELQPPDFPTCLRVLDTVGYSHSGPSEDQLHATEEAARQSDLLLLVVHALNPARQADLQMLQGLRRWFATHVDLKMPPVLGVMTHIDLLSPALEWAPPYDWVEPKRPKEEQLHQAWTAVREQLGDYLVGIVPVCTSPAKEYGIEEWLLPTLAELLDESRAVALLRCIRAETDTGKIRKVFKQLLEVSRTAAKALWRIDR